MNSSIIFKFLQHKTIELCAHYWRVVIKQRLFIIMMVSLILIDGPTHFQIWKYLSHNYLVNLSVFFIASFLLQLSAQNILFKKSSIEQFESTLPLPYSIHALSWILKQTIIHAPLLFYLVLGELTYLLSAPEKLIPILLIFTNSILSVSLNYFLLRYTLNFSLPTFPSYHLPQVTNNPFLSVSFIKLKNFFDNQKIPILTFIFFSTSLLLFLQFLLDDNQFLRPKYFLFLFFISINLIAIAKQKIYFEVTDKDLQWFWSQFPIEQNNVNHFILFLFSLPILVYSFIITPHYLMLSGILFNYVAFIFILNKFLDHYYPLCLFVIIATSSFFQYSIGAN